MTHDETVAFARDSASMAHDQRDAYDDARASFRENVIDTLTDDHANVATYSAALTAYDAAADRLFGTK